MAKIPNFDSFGAVFLYFYPDKRDIWHRPLCQISCLSDQCVAPVGQNISFGPLSKNNTGMAVAALRAGLPVIITRGQSNLTKSASRGPIPRSGVTPGGRNLYH